MRTSDARVERNRCYELSRGFYDDGLSDERFS